MTFAGDAARTLRSHRKPYTLVCQECGAPFNTTDKRGLYCSSRCRYRARANRDGRKARKPSAS